MSREDVARLAAAIAKANGHTEADEWASRVADAWEALAPAPEPAEVPAGG